MNIDEYIVQMKFNNSQFQDGVKGTQESLDLLKKSLKLDGATKGLTELSEAGKRFSLSNIADGVDNISSKFGALGAIGFTIFQSLTNSALTFGKKIAGAILNPLVEGGKKRALTIEQAKFQFEGLGMDVESTMESARLAVTGTAYGLESAAKAASMFGASGMRAGEEMTGSLRAIAGVAAMTGSSYDDIANVFTAVAGNGRVMGSDLLRLSSRGVNAAATLAKTFGLTEARVREMVTEGEISFEMFSESMNGAFGEHATSANKTYTGSLANMKAALGRIGAEVATRSFESLRKIFNATTPVIDNVKKALMPLIDAFGEASSIKADNIVGFLEKLDLSVLTEAGPYVLTIIKNIADALRRLIMPIKSAFQKIFPPATAEQFINLLEILRRFTYTLKIGSSTAVNLHKTFAGFFAIFSIGFQILKKVVVMFANLFSSATNGGDGLLGFTAKIGDWLVKVDMALKTGDKLNNFFIKLEEYLQVPVALLKSFGILIAAAFGKMGGIDTGGVEGLGNKLQSTFAPLGHLGEVIKTIWTNVANFFKKIWKFIEPVVVSIGHALEAVGTKIGDMLSDLTAGDVVGIISTALAGGAVYMLRNFITSISGLFKGTTKFTFMSSLRLTLIGVQNQLKIMQGILKAKTLLMIAAAIGILALSLIGLSMVDPVKLAVATAAITAMFYELMLAFKAFEGVSTEKSVGKIIGIGIAMILLAVAVSILAGAVVKLSKLTGPEMATGLIGITVILALLAGTAKVFEKIQGSMVRAAFGIGVMAIALKILASAVSDFAEFDESSLKRGLAGVAGILTIMALFAKVSGSTKGAIRSAIGLTVMALALKVLASAVGDFAAYSPEELIRGGAAIAGLLTVLAIFSKTVGKPSKLIKMAVSMVILGGALKIMASALSDFGAIPLDQVEVGLAGMAGMLGIVAVAMHAMPKNMLVTGASLVVVAYALEMIAGVMSTLGGLSWEQLAVGLVMLAGSLGIIAIAMYAMSGALPGAAALIVVAFALSTLLPTLLAMSALPWQALLMGLGALAAVFAVIGLAGLVLTPVIPSLLLLGAAVALLGIGAMAAGTAMLLFGIGITALVAVGAAGVAVVVLMVTELLKLIPLAAEQLGLGIVAFAKVISESGPVFVDAMVTLVRSLLEAINTTAPEVVQTLLDLVWLLVDTIVENVPKFVDSGFKLITGVLDGIANNIGDIVDSATAVVTEFIDGIADNIPDILESGADLLISFLEGIATTIDTKSQEIQDAGWDIAEAMIKGMTSGLTGGLSKVGEAAKNVAKNAWEGAKNFLNINSPSKKFITLGESTGEGMVVGMRNYAGRVRNEGSAIGEGAVDSLMHSISGISKMVSSEMDVSPTIRPVLDLSGVKRDAQLLGGMMGSPKLAIDATYASASGIALDTKVAQANRDEMQALLNVPVAPSMEFKQYNYSPKALSEIEIYRQTNNQISAAKGALTNQ